MPTTASQKAPAPSPTSTLPSEITSSDAAALASMAGGLRGRLATSGKKRTFSVTGTSVEIRVQVSRNRRWYGWSWMPTRSNPVRSATLATLAAWPDGSASGSTLTPNSSGLP